MMDRKGTSWTVSKVVKRYLSRETEENLILLVYSLQRRLVFNKNWISHKTRKEV
jgi:hypothetical protein